MPKITSRQQLLDTATDLFYREGIRATGVDTLAAVSGIGKMTLYRHFATKDDLIVAYLERSDQQFWDWFENAIAKAETPRQKILAFFQAVENLALNPTCHGCPFLNAAVDFPDPSHPSHRVAVEHKNAVRARFRDLATQANLSNPELLADQLLLLMDGAFMAVRLYGVDNPAVHVSKAAEALMSQA
jgi:AcrR family transcriptional regulator